MNLIWGNWKEWLWVPGKEWFWYFSNWNGCATWNCCQQNLMSWYGVVAIISACLILFIFWIMLMTVYTTYMQWLWEPQKGSDSLVLELQIAINPFVSARNWMNQVPLEEQPVRKNTLPSPQQHPLYFRASVTTCTTCGTPICKCLKRHFTSQARSLINFITTFSLPKMVLSSLLTCIIQYCWLWDGSSYFQVSDLSCKDKDMLSMYFIVFGSAF